MIARLVTLGLTVLLVVSVLQAVSPRARDEDEPEFRRRRARWASVAAGIVVGYLLVVAIVRLQVGGTPNPLGMVVYVALCVAVAVSVPVLRRAWRAVRTAEKAARPPDLAAPHELAPRPHRSLSGDDDLPTRW